MAARRSTLPLLALCAGALLPWTAAPQSGLLEGGRYVLLLACIGLLLDAARPPGLRRIAMVAPAVSCLALAGAALAGDGALGALLTAAASVVWLVRLARA